MGIDFMDLKTQYRQMADPIRARIDAVLEHGRYIMGPEVAELEAALAAFTGTGHVLSCSSGTDALLMPLIARGIGPGDAVFTTSFTFFATAEVIAHLGATPVFVDIDRRTFNMDPESLRQAVASIDKQGRLRPRAVIPVDLFGLTADYAAIDEIAAHHDLFVIEDAAQSLGGSCKGRMAGSFGHVAATSFYPAKPLGCYGDGGAIFTDDAALAALMKSIRVHGEGVDKYDNVRIGINGRLDTIQAAILLEKMVTFEQELEARRRVAARYSSGLQGVNVPLIPPHHESAWALYTITCDQRDALREALAAKGIPTVVYYDRPLHLQTAFAKLGHRPGDFPVSEWVSRHVVSLPMHPFLADAAIDQVIAAVNEFTAARS